MNLDCAAKLDKLDKLDERFGKGQEGLGSLLTGNSLEMELLGSRTMDDLRSWLARPTSFFSLAQAALVR